MKGHNFKDQCYFNLDKWKFDATYLPKDMKYGALVKKKTLIIEFIFKIESLFLRAWVWDGSNPQVIWNNYLSRYTLSLPKTFILQANWMSSQFITLAVLQHYQYSKIS